MKDLAQSLRRARVKPKPRKRHHRSEAPHPATQPSRPQGVAGEVPDAWDPKHHPDLQQRAREARKEIEARKERDRSPDITEEEQAEADEEGFEVVKRKTLARRKKRVFTMGFAVSEEEEAILRAHVQKLDVTFSEWARRTLFRAVGRKVPARPRKS